MGKKVYLKTIKVDEISCGTGLKQPCYFTYMDNGNYRVWCSKLEGTHYLPCDKKIIIQITKKEYDEIKGKKYIFKFKIKNYENR